MPQTGQIGRATAGGLCIKGRGRLLLVISEAPIVGENPPILARFSEPPSYRAKHSMSLPFAHLNRINPRKIGPSRVGRIRAGRTLGESVAITQSPCETSA